MTEWRDVSGWLDDEDADLLRWAVADVCGRGVPGDVVEVGSYQGRSTVVLAQALRQAGAAGRVVCAIDPHEGMIDVQDGERQQVAPTLQELRRNLAACGVSDLVDVQVGTVDTARLPAQISVAFVDGLHDRDSVLHDVRALLPRLAPGGLVICHDYCRDWPGVMEAVDCLVADGALRWVWHGERVAIGEQDGRDQ